MDVTIRSNPHVELAMLDELALFVAKPPFTMTVKAAERETAALFESLAVPARLDRPLADVVDLVLDGILEIDSGDGFVFGADALPLVGVAACEPGGTLSRDALLHAQELESRDPHALAMALYRYNCIPITPFWRARFATPESILAHLGADRGTLRAMLERDWIRSPEPGTWLSWTSTIAPLQGGERDATYKLYVSPRPERIRDAFEALVRVLVSIPATFKIGGSAAAILRPDKLCAYFNTSEELDEAASMLRRELAGCDAHGVPFTAALDDSGLLSWGIDPPESERVLRWLERDSWRLWIAKRLGGALAIAKAARTPAAAAPWRFAVARVERLGVDVERWLPSPSLWSAS